MGLDVTYIVIVIRVTGFIGPLFSMSPTLYLRIENGHLVEGTWGRKKPRHS